MNQTPENGEARGFQKLRIKAELAFENWLDNRLHPSPKGRNRFMPAAGYSVLTLSVMAGLMAMFTCHMNASTPTNRTNTADSGSSSNSKGVDHLSHKDTWSFSRHSGIVNETAGFSVSVFTPVVDDILQNPLYGINLPPDRAAIVYLLPASSRPVNGINVINDLVINLENSGFSKRATQEWYRRSNLCPNPRNKCNLEPSLNIPIYDVIEAVLPNPASAQDLPPGGFMTRRLTIEFTRQWADALNRHVGNTQGSVQKPITVEALVGIVNRGPFEVVNVDRELVQRALSDIRR